MKNPVQFNTPYQINLGIIGSKSMTDKYSNSGLEEIFSTLLDPDVYFKEDINQPSIFQFYKKESQKLLRKNIVDNQRIRLEYTIHSCLAAGPDLLFPNAVINNPGWISEIKGILPMTQKQYLINHFDKSGFQEISRKLSGIKLVNKKEIKSQAAKAKAFNEASELLVERSDIIIALWDGTSKFTHYAIEYAIQRQKVVLLISDQEDLNILNAEFYNKTRVQQDDELFVYYVVSKPADQKTVAKKLQPIQKIPYQKLDARSIKDVIQFNSNLKNHFDIDKIEAIKKNHYWDNDIPSPILEKIWHPHDLKERFLYLDKILLPIFCTSEIIATRCKQTFIRIGGAVLFLALFSITAIAVGVVYPAFYQTSFIIESIALFIILAIIIYGTLNRVHQTWLHYRFLAERIRLLKHFILLGESYPRTSTNPYYSSSFEDTWIIRILYHVQEVCDHQLTHTKSNSSRKVKNQKLELQKDYLVNGIVKDQLSYHYNTLKGMKRKNIMFKWTGILIFALALSFALIHCLLHPTGFFDKFLLFSALLLPAVATAIEGYRRQNDFSQLAKRSESTFYGLQELKSRIMRVKTGPEFIDVLYSLNNLLLRENQSWMMTRELVELEPQP